MKAKIKSYWETLSPERKRKASMSALIGVVILFSLVAYELRSSPVIPPRNHESAEKPVDLNASELERSAYLESKKAGQIMSQRLKRFEQDMTNRLASFQKNIAEQTAKTTPQPPIPSTKTTSTGGGDTVKLPPAPGEGGRKRWNSGGVRHTFPPAPGAPPVPGAGGKNMGPQYIGGISSVSAPISKDLGDGTGVSNAPGKKKEETVYLPTSFMEATLISGLDAPTVERAKGNPMPALIRVKAPAILPNRVRANLKGCFVIASGYGDLAAERAYLRLDTLSCISKKGRSVIDQAIKGFVVDADGKIGLRGRVVSKMGATIARSMIAGFFGGVGDALRAAATTTSVSPFGTTQIIDTGQLAQAGIGSGLGEAAKEIQRFYLELARQTMPVIEVGATKQITLVVQKGVELVIKDACVGMEEDCENTID